MCLLPHSTEVTPSKATKNFPALARVAQWIECGLQTKGLLVLFPVRAHACIAGQVPSGGHVRGNHTWMFLPLFKKKKKKEFPSIPQAFPAAPAVSWHCCAHCWRALASMTSPAGTPSRFSHHFKVFLAAFSKLLLRFWYSILLPPFRHSDISPWADSPTPALSLLQDKAIYMKGASAAYLPGPAPTVQLQLQLQYPSVYLNPKGSSSLLAFTSFCLNANSI